MVVIKHRNSLLVVRSKERASTQTKGSFFMTKLELRLRTFIPDERVRFTKSGDTEVWFNGDGRGSQWEGSYKTSQRVTIDTSKSDYGLNFYKDIGETIRTVYDDGELISTIRETAPLSGLTASYRISSDDLYIDVTGHADNPLAPSAAINYAFTIKVTRAESVRITGSHDGFPAYELWRKISTRTYPEQCWYYNPYDNGATISNLFPPMEKTVDISKSI